MKILYIAASCNPYNGSEDQIGWNIPYSASQRYDEVYVITDYHQKKYVEKYCKENNMQNIHFYYIDISNTYKKVFKGFLFSTRLYFWMKKAFKIAKKICEEENIKIIHQITPVEFRMIGNFKKIKSIKFIVGPIGGGVNTPKALKKYGKEKVLIEFIRKIANKFFSIRYNFINSRKKWDYILYSNEETAKILEKKYNYKERLYTEIGINKSSIKNRNINKGTDLIRFVVVGRLIYLKGHDFLLDAIENVKSDRNFIVTIVGDGPKYDKLYTRIMNNEILKKRIELLGKVEFNKINKIYDESNALILPSIRENTGTVIIEAMSRGLPVILYNGFGGKLIVNNNNGWLYTGKTQEDNIKCLVEIIEEILDNPNMINEKGYNALKDAQKYTWDKKIDYFDNIYRKVLGNNHEEE